MPSAEMGGMSPSAGMQGMMGGEQGCCGNAQGDLLYPSLINLAALTPQQRDAYDSRARARVTEGALRLQRAHERLGQAVAMGELGTAQGALQEVRAALGWLEGGLATYAMLSGNQAPKQVALDWFRREMGAIPGQASGSTSVPHGLFGLTSFHYFVMLALAALALTLLWIYRQRSRRTTALLARLATSASAAPVPSPPQTAQGEPAAAPGSMQPMQRTAAPDALPAAAGASAALAPTPARVNPEVAASAPNSWSGLLQVARIFRETAQVKTFRLIDPAGGKLPFSYLPGQFLTVTVAPNAKAVRRSYTIASAPTRRDYCEITVRREEHGIVSGYLHDQVHQGELLQIMAPAGRFTFTGEESDSVVLIAGGVGITPMMSVIRYLTDRCWPGQIDLVFGCKADDDVIFREELEYLKRRYPNLRITLIAGQADASTWPYRVGRISKDVLVEVVPGIASKRIHVCGPGPMMDAVKQTLAELGVPSENVKTEAFIGKERPVMPPADAAAASASTASASTTGAAAAVGPIDSAVAPTSATLQQALARFARSNKTAPLPPTKTILEAAEDVGVNIEYACRAGTCGTCRVKLLAGTVTMDVEEGLEPTDKTEHIVLACQAKSTSDVTVDA